MAQTTEVTEKATGGSHLTDYGVTTTNGSTVDSRSVDDEVFDEEGYKLLHVKPSTHASVRRTAKRLDKSIDSIVLAGLLLLDEKTGDRRAQSDREWALSIAAKSTVSS